MKPRLNLLTMESTLEWAWQRLMQTVIECKDFRDLIPRYDRKHTLFFLDPPYYKRPGYKHDFKPRDFKDLRSLLKGIKGKFLMTINDTPETRDIFNNFHIQKVTLKYSTCTTKKARSLHISVY